MSDKAFPIIILKWLKRVLFWAVALFLVVVIAGPWGLYWLGLDSVEGKPTLPVTTASPEKIQAIWVLAQGVGSPEVPVMSPYSVIYDAITYDYKSRGLQKELGGFVAAGIARQYVQEHRKHRGNLWWHLSSAAMTIWLTRNWTQEQIFSKAMESGFVEYAEAVGKNAERREEKRLHSLEGE